MYWERHQHSCSVNSGDDRIEDIIDRIFLKLSLERQKSERYWKKKDRDKPHIILVIAYKLWKLIKIFLCMDEEFDANDEPLIFERKSSTMFTIQEGRLIIHVF